MPSLIVNLYRFLKISGFKRPEDQIEVKKKDDKKPDKNQDDKKQKDPIIDLHDLVVALTIISRNTQEEKLKRIIFY